MRRRALLRTKNMSSSLFRLSGKVALVSGASSGLGWRFAKVLAGAGAAVGVTARRSDRLVELCREISADGGRVHAVAADLTDVAGIELACKEVEAALGPIDVLVNNAGTSREGPALSLSEEAFDNVMGINTRAPYFLAQHVARQMVRHKRGGSIINVSSAVAHRVGNGISAYAMSKAAIDQARLGRASAAPRPRRCTHCGRARR